MSRNLLAGNHEGRLQVVQYHSRREGPQFVFLDLGFVFKILMRNGSRFRIESIGINSRTEIKSCFGVHCIFMSRNLLAGNHEGRLQVVQYHSRREGPQFVFLDLGFVFKILMRNGSRFRIESMHLECRIPNNQDHGIGQKFQFWAVITFLPGPWDQSGRLFEAERLLSFHHFQQV